MPGFDRKGPSGAGARTGMGRGPCGQAAGTTSFSWSGFIRGIGRGEFPWGGGRGRCLGGRGSRLPFGGAASATPTGEADALRADIAAAKEGIAAMEARLSELEQKG
jgi:hypothetical protein